MTDAAKYLIECGVRPSVQRIAILEYVATHPTHPTVDEIFAALQPRIPTLSCTTVYSTLRLLVEAGVIDSVNIDRTSERFDGNTILHAHFMCEQCGRIIDTAIESPDEVTRYAPQGARVDKAQVLYRGLCAECLKNR